MTDYSQLIGTCISQIETGANIPFAWFDLGKCYMLQGKAGDAFPAFVNAVESSTAADELHKMLAELATAHDKVENKGTYDIVLRLLKMGLAGKFRDKRALSELAARATPGMKALDGAIFILAGSCDAAEDEKVESYRDLLISAFKDYFGTIISGGTKHGVGRLAGDIQEKYPKIAFSIGYVPEKLPEKVERDERYSEIRTTPGSRFNVSQPVQYWTDIVASGIDPRTVSVLGIGGNSLSHFEYLMGLALGAKVAALEGSIGGVRNLSGELLWKPLKGVVALPEDAYTLRAFVGTGLPPFPDEIRDVLARALHETYRYADSDQKTEQSMKKWEQLSPELRHSNYAAADHIIQKLNEVGYKINVVSEGEIKETRFTNEEVEILAQMEHARWMAERLMKGWVHGETKDFEKKTDPSLVLWDVLPEPMKEIDRMAVIRLPKFLKDFDLQMRRASK